MDSCQESLDAQNQCLYSSVFPVSLTIIHCSPFSTPSFTKRAPSHCLTPSFQSSLYRVVSVSLRHMVTTLVDLFTQEIDIGCLPYAITTIDSRISSISKTGTIHIFLLICKKTQVSIIQDQLIAFLSTEFQRQVPFFFRKQISSGTEVYFLLA